MLYWYDSFVSVLHGVLTKPRLRKPGHGDIGLGLGNKGKERVRVRNRDRVR